MSRWTISVRDPSFAETGEVDQFTSMELVARFNAVGVWQLVIPAALPDAKFDPAAELVAGAGIVVRRDGTTILSGPVTGRARQWDESNDLLTISGVTDDVALEDRLAVPSASPYTAAAYDTRTGVAETVMRGYVDANAGPSAIAARRTVTLESDLARGSTVTGTARFDVLADMLRELAIAGGNLGFTVAYTKGTGLSFHVYQPRDLSASVIFSPGMGNLRAFSYEDTAGEGNHVIVGGGGVGTSRTFVETEDATAISRWGRRVEFFRDRRDTTDTAQMTQTADEELANHAEPTKLTITPIDTSAVAYLRDYTLGDKVSVEVDGVRISDIVREVHLTLTGTGGEQIFPTVGTPNAAPGVEFFQRLRQVRRRVGQLEKRQ